MFLFGFWTGRPPKGNSKEWGREALERNSERGNNYFPKEERGNKLPRRLGSQRPGAFSISVNMADKPKTTNKNWANHGWDVGIQEARSKKVALQISFDKCGAYMWRLGRAEMRQCWESISIRMVELRSNGAPRTARARTIESYFHITQNL